MAAKFHHLLQSTSANLGDRGVKMSTRGARQTGEDELGLISPRRFFAMNASARAQKSSLNLLGIPTSHSSHRS
jgi:hypothetical protein